MRGPSFKPYKGALPITPPTGDILGRIFVALQRENHPDSDLNYFRNHLLPKYHVPFEDHGDYLVAAINDPILDNNRAVGLLRVEATGPRGPKPIRRHVSIRQDVRFTEPEDRKAFRELIYEQMMMTTVEELRYHPRTVYPRGGLYIIWDEYEKECLYIGITGGDPAGRADQHFHRDNNSEVAFDAHCRQDLRQTMPWKVYLIDPAWCDYIVRKSLFWNQEEYNTHMQRIEDEYFYKITNDCSWFLRRAEWAFIALFKPCFNTLGNAYKLLRKRAKKSSGYIT